MKYQEIILPWDLSNVVRTFWTLETGPTNPKSQTVRIFAEGYIGFLYQEIDYKPQAGKETKSTFNLMWFNSPTLWVGKDKKVPLRRGKAIPTAVGRAGG